jgi:hypothetical protein
MGRKYYLAQAAEIAVPVSLASERVTVLKFADRSVVIYLFAPCLCRFASYRCSHSSIGWSSPTETFTIFGLWCTDENHEE